MATDGERIKAKMQALAPGPRVVKPRQRGEIYGLRLHNGLAVPTVVVLGMVPDGFHKAATVLVPYGPPQPVESDPTSIWDQLSPLTPPMIVGRILFSLGFAFRWGALPPTEPVLGKRLVFHDLRGGSVRLLGGEPVRAVSSDDLVVPTSHMLPIGVDQAIGKALGASG